MKNIMSFMICICLALQLTGCTFRPAKQTPPPIAPQTTSADEESRITNTADISDTMHSIGLYPMKESIASKDSTPLFSLTYQDIALTLHNDVLEEKIIDDLCARSEPLLKEADEIKTQAQQDCLKTEYCPEYFVDISYTPTRFDGSVLSLFRNTTSYYGGAHPAIVTSSVTYDLRSGEALYLDEVLSSDCTSDDLYQLIVRNLDSQSDDLYYDYVDAVGDRFTGELHSLQNWYFSRSGLCFHFAPYEIAPYSSGTIIAELPYSSLTGVIKEQYFPQKTPEATGSMYANTYAESDKERFNFIADIPLCASGKDILLFPDATVTDLRIETGYRYSDTGQYIATNTIFAANAVTVGDAMHLTADIHNPDSLLRLVYHSNQQEYSAFISYDDTINSVILTKE